MARSATPRASVVETACPARLPGRLHAGGDGRPRQGRRNRRLAQESRHRAVTSARRFASSANASTGRSHPLSRRAAAARRARARSRASRGTKRSRSSRSVSHERKRRRARESILPYSYGGSNGLLTQDNLDAQLWRRFGTSRLARTVCAAPTGAANHGLYGKMAGVTYQDYPHAKLIVLWGVNPSASGIHLVPFVRDAQKRGAKLVVIDPRATSHAHAADLHLAIRPGTDVVARARRAPVSVRGRPRRRGVPARAHARRRATARARRTVDDRKGGRGLRPGACRRRAVRRALRATRRRR